MRWQASLSNFCQGQVRGAKACRVARRGYVVRQQLTGSRRNGMRKIGPTRAGRHAGQHSSGRRGDLGYLAYNGWEHDPRGGAAEQIARPAAPGRPFPGRKLARLRARKAAPAAAIAATIAAGAAAYGLVGSVGTAPALTAEVASAPAGGYALSGGNVLARAGVPATAATTAAVSPVTASSVTVKPATAYDAGVSRLAEAIASNMTASRQALIALGKTAVASSAAKAHAAAAAKAAAAKAAAAKAAAAKAAAAKPKATALTCDTSRGMLPANVTAIVSFLLAHGYTHNAAAGIAGNIYRES